MRYSDNVVCFIFYNFFHSARLIFGDFAENFDHSSTGSLNRRYSHQDPAAATISTHKLNQLHYNGNGKIGSTVASTVNGQRMSAFDLMLLNQGLNYSTNGNNESDSLMDAGGNAPNEPGGIDMGWYRSDVKIIYVTNWFLRKLQPNSFPDDLLTDDELTDDKLFLKSLVNNNAQWLKYELGFIIVIALSCILALFLTFGYLIYVCCCRRRTACCKDDLRSLPYTKAGFVDGEISACRRFSLNLFLFILIAVMALLTACALISNIVLHDATSKFGSNLRRSIKDVSTYQSDTIKQLNRLLVDDYSIFESRVNLLLDSSSYEFASYAFGKANSSQLNALARAIDDLESSGPLFDDVRSQINLVETDLESFKSNLTEVDEWLENQLKACRLGNTDQKEILECSKAQDYSSQYSRLLDDLNLFSNFEEFDRYFDDFNSTLEISSIKERFRAGIEHLRSRLNDSVLNEKYAISDQMNRIRMKLEDARKSIARSIDNVSLTGYETYIDQVEPKFMAFEYYRWIAAFGICIKVGFIIICLFVALLFSVCGQRPGQYTRTCCLWSKSGGFFSCANAMVLWTLCSSMIIMCVLFFVGGNGRVILCHDMQSPGEKSGLYKLSERYWNIYKPHINAFIHGPNEEQVPHIPMIKHNFSDVVEGCLQNKTFYSIFDLGKRSSLDNLNSITDQIQRDSEAFMEKFRASDFRIDFLDEIDWNGDLYAKKFSEFDRNVNLSPEHLRELEFNVSALNFNASLQNLQDFANETNHATLKHTLNSLLFRLFTLNELLSPIRQNCLNLLQKMKRLTSHTLPETLNALAVLTSGVKTTAADRQSLTDYARTLTRRLADGLKLSVQDYATHVQNQLETQISSCVPVIKIYTDLSDAVCYHALDHFNSFWTCVGLALFLLIPSVIITTSLRNMYADSLKCDTDSGRSSNSRRCIVDAYSTVTDDYGCYRRCSDSSYNNPVGRNWNVHNIKYPTTASPCFTELENRRMPPPYSRR